MSIIINNKIEYVFLFFSFKIFYYILFVVIDVNKIYIYKECNFFFIYMYK